VHTSQMGSPALSVRAVQRQLATLLPEARPAAPGEGTLEIAGQGNDAPRLISATVLEGGPLRARRIVDPPTPGFRAFLDGTQRSELVSYLPGGVPVILGRVAAVVRERRNRRMHTWHQPLTETRLYCARRLVLPAAWDTLRDVYGSQLVDITDDAAELAPHPFALRDAAVHRVQAHREQLEQRLAERWCNMEHDPLFIDGGISGNERLATNDCVVGVVKNHRTLYVEGEGLDVVFGLRAGERTSVFEVTSPKRTTVASWYLRLRDPIGRDPMWGLVRVEINYAHADTDSLVRRAGEASRRILAEISPVALPDSRWDRMVYGIRDCEEFLRSVM